MANGVSGYYWGNYFYPETPFAIERGRWYCFEVMVKANEPGKKSCISKNSAGGTSKLLS